MTDMHEAAFRAGVWSVIASRAKELADAAKAELAALEVGDTVAGRYQGQIVAKATKTKGRAKLVVTDPDEFVNWVAGHHPTEIVSQVNPAFVKHIESRAREYGAPIDTLGELIPGVELVEGDPYITVRKDGNAPFLVAQLLSSGQLSLEGPRDWQAEVESGAIG